MLVWHTRLENTQVPYACGTEPHLALSKEPGVAISIFDTAFAVKRCYGTSASGPQST